MSLQGNIEKKNELRGSAFVPEFIQGKSAYDIAVMHGFEGTEEEWLESLKADFDERADEAKANIDAEVDNVIVPEAKAELDKAKTEAIKNAAAEIDKFTAESKELLEKAGETADEKEVLLWENPSPNAAFGAQSIDISANIDGIDSIRIVFFTNNLEAAVLPSIQMKLAQASLVHYARETTTYERDFFTTANGTINFYDANPNNEHCIPYRVYGVKNNDINIPAMIPEMIQESIMQTTGESVTSVMSQKGVSGLSDYFPAKYRMAWQIGGMNTSGEVITNSSGKYRIVTTDIQVFDFDITVSTAEGYRVYIASYDAEGNYTSSSGWKTTEYTIEAGRRFRIQVAQTTDDTVPDGAYGAWFDALKCNSKHDVDVASMQNNMQTEITDVQNDLASMQTEITDVQTDIANLYESIPNYYETHLSEKINTISNIELNSSKSNLQFAFITDTHIERNSLNSPKLIKELLKNTNTRFVVNGGDFIDTEDTKEEVVTLLRNWRNSMYGVDEYRIRGNHDFNQVSQSNAEAKLNEYEYMNTLFKSFDYKVTNYYAKAYTIDDEFSKVRLICNDYSMKTDNAFGTWFRERLTELDNTWTILVIQHYLYDTDLTSIHEYGQRTIDIINEVYSSIKAKLIGVLAGHTHADISTTESTNGYHLISTTADARTDEGGLTRTKGTVNEQAFDVVHIDTINRKIYFTRIGAGDDREWSY